MVVHLAYRRKNKLEGHVTRMKTLDLRLNVVWLHATTTPTNDLARLIY